MILSHPERHSSFEAQTAKLTRWPAGDARSQRPLIQTSTLGCRVLGFRGIYKDNIGIMERTMETTTGFRVRGASIDGLRRTAQGSLRRAVLLPKKFHLTRTTQNVLPLGNLSERRLLNTVGLLLTRPGEPTHLYDH